MAPPTLRYREFAPPPALAPLARCVWSVEGDAGDGVEQRVLPDGCCDLLLDRGDDLALHWIGPQRRPLVFTPRGPFRATGLRLRPGAARALVGLPARDLVDGGLAFALHAPMPWRPLRDAVSIGNDTGRLGRALHAIAPRLAALADGDTRRWIAWLESLRALPLHRVRDLASLTGVTSRTLERRMRDTVGLAPREFLAGLRFDRARHAIERRRDALADIASACGYADQAHLTREFRRHAGLSPGAWRRRADVAFVQDDAAAMRDAASPAAAAAHPETRP